MVAQRYEYYFQVVKTIFYEQMQGESKILFQHKKIKFISSSYHVMFFFIIWSEVGTSEQRTYNPEGKHTCFSHVTYFFIS